MIKSFPRENYRVVHLTTSYVKIGQRRVLIPNRALATYNRQRNNLVTNIKSFTEHTIREYEENSAATLALIHYNDQSLWWVLCMFNGIIFPTRELIAGEKIRIPNLSEVRNALVVSLQDTDDIQRFVQI